MFLCRACVGLPPINHMMLEHKLPALMGQGLAVPLLIHSKVPPTKTTGAHSVSNSHGPSHVNRDPYSVANGDDLPHVNGVVINGY